MNVVEHGTDIDTEPTREPADHLRRPGEDRRAARSRPYSPGQPGEIGHGVPGPSPNPTGERTVKLLTFVTTVSSLVGGRSAGIRRFARRAPRSAR